MIWELKSFVLILKDAIIPLVIGGIFFLNVWQNSAYIRIQKDILKTNQDIEKLEVRNEDLKISILTQTSVEKIDQIYSRSIQEQIKTPDLDIITLKLPVFRKIPKDTSNAN